MSLSIDNPLIFVYPQSLAVSHQPRSTLPSNGTPPTPQTRSAGNNNNINSLPSPFPSFRPQPPTNHQDLLSDSQIVQSSAHELDSRSTILSGSLILKFHKPKEIKKIIISLCGESYIGFNDRPYEYQKILAKDLEINLDAQLSSSQNHQRTDPGNVQYNSQHKTYILDKGNYRFHWSFILPPDLPPYERGQFGFTTHKVVAKVKLGSGLALGLKSVGKNLPSIILGVGHGGHEIETESYFVAITYPSGNNDDPGDNLGLNLNITELSEHLGDKDARTGGPAESWPPCQRRRVFVLDHTNVPTVTPVLSNGPSSNSSDPPLHGPHVDETSNSVAESRVQPDCAASRGRTVTSSSQERSRSPHLRSRSHLRGFLRNRTRSRDDRNLEAPHPPNQLIHSWNHFPSMRIGGGRAQSSHRETEEMTREPRLYSSRSTGGLGSTLSVSSHANQNHSNPAASFQRDDATAAVSQSCASESHSSPQHNTTVDVARNPQDSGESSLRQAISGTTHEAQGSAGLGALETRTVSMERPSGSPAINTARGGRQEATPSTLSHPATQKRNGKSQEGSKWRPGQRPNPHLPHADSDVPLVTLTDDHHSWEIEHMGYSVEDDKSLEPRSASGIPSGKSPPRPPPRITKKVLSIRKPVQISSCCCMAESMVLPPYSKLDPNAEFVQHPTPSHAARMLQCVCDTPTDVLMKTQNPKDPLPNAIAHRHVSEGNSSAPVTHSVLTLRSSTSGFGPSCNPQDSDPVRGANTGSYDHFHHGFISLK